MCLLKWPLNFIKISLILKQKKEQAEEEYRVRELQLQAEKKRSRAEMQRKMNERKIRLQKQKSLGEHWGLLKWVTQFLIENTPRWDKERKERIKREKEELEEWEKKKRHEKIQWLKLRNTEKGPVSEIERKLKAAQKSAGWKV